MGNENANSFWYKHPPDGRVIDKNTPPLIRYRHIQEKYKHKKFADFLVDMEKANVDQVTSLTL